MNRVTSHQLLVTTEERELVMAQPKKKISKTRRDTRRANWAKLDAPNIFKCPQCAGPVLAHHACPACGTYKGRQVLTVKVAKSKKAKD